MHARAIERYSSQTLETPPDNTSISISRAFCRCDCRFIFNPARFVSSWTMWAQGKLIRWHHRMIPHNIILSIEIFGPISFGHLVSVRRSTSVSLCDRLLRALYPLGVSRAKRKAAVEAIRRPGSLALTRDPLAWAFFTLRRSGRTALA